MKQINLVGVETGKSEQSCCHQRIISTFNTQKIQLARLLMAHLRETLKRRQLHDIVIKSTTPKTLIYSHHNVYDNGIEIKRLKRNGRATVHYQSLSGIINVCQNKIPRNMHGAV